ncbi:MULTISPECIES: GNAT family N-acetyltransferase [Clostridia]|uniref:GNAT family N-acetyltransferase n=1 Tax=Clostridia TaxID=186801 RepID=UPI000EA407CB|nr:MULTISPECIES: GNAT family N-acetyltransferase [Clostridia]NBJ69329.1 GNAT family N-acetyltransferase [Roseburia sp. 1XD42-34]RKI78996.1 GNAT family N-acetyltransferase [Clostridium sp. 1xD42-85]
MAHKVIKFEGSDVILVVDKLDETVKEKCVDIYIDTFSQEPWNDIFSSRQIVVDFFDNHLDNNYFLGYVAKIKEEVVGLCIGMKKPWIKGMEYYIDEFCISHSFQNKGIGTVFIKTIEDEIKKQGLNGILLNTERQVPAFQFYVNNGFNPLNELAILAK